MFNEQDKELDHNKKTDLDSVSSKRNPGSDNELADKKYVVDSIRDGNVLRFNQTFENYLKVSFGNDNHNLTKTDKIQITDTTIIKYPNTGGYLLQNCVRKRIDKNNGGKIQNFMQTTKTTSATGNSRATSIPPIGDSFMCNEASSNNQGSNVSCSFKRIDIIQISNITF